MGGHLFPEIRCAICSDPVDLCVDMCADENGEPVHEGCYVNRLATACLIQLSAEKLLDTLSTQQTLLYCVKCNAPLSYIGATFFLEGGKSRTIPLPVCKNCNRRERHPLYIAAA